MKYYSEEEIIQMKQNGFESITIDSARKIQHRADVLISEICEAFKSVKLEEGTCRQLGRMLLGSFTERLTTFWCIYSIETNLM